MLAHTSILKVENDAENLKRYFKVINGLMQLYDMLIAKTYERNMKNIHDQKFSEYYKIWKMKEQYYYAKILFHQGSGL